MLSSAILGVVTAGLKEESGSGPEFGLGSMLKQASALLTLMPYKDLYFKVFGPKDHVVQGLEAILSLRVNDVHC